MAGGWSGPAIAAGLLVLVLLLALGGVRVGVAAQLGLVAVLVVVVVLAVGGSASHAQAASWTPFAPHGWGAIGQAAATLMLSFVGWEAVAPLTAGSPTRAASCPGSSRSPSP